MVSCVYMQCLLAPGHQQTSKLDPLLPLWLNFHSFTLNRGGCFTTSTSVVPDVLRQCQILPGKEPTEKALGAAAFGKSK